MRRNEPREEQYLEIANNISKRLVKAYESWHSATISALKEVGRKNEDYELEFKDGVKEIDTKLEIMFKGFVLFEAICFLSEKKYIHPNKGKNFSDVLLACMSNNSVEDLSSKLAYYAIAEKNYELGSSGKFAFDYCKHISISEKSALMAFVIVGGLVSNQLVIPIRLFVAGCFGDLKTVRKIGKKLNE